MQIYYIIAILVLIMQRKGDKEMLDDKDKILNKNKTDSFDPKSKQPQDKKDFVKGEWKVDLSPEEIEKKRKRSEANKKSKTTQKQNKENFSQKVVAEAKPQETPIVVENLKNITDVITINVKKKKDTQSTPNEDTGKKVVLEQSKKPFKTERLFLKEFFAKKGVSSKQTKKAPLTAEQKAEQKNISKTKQQEAFEKISGKTFSNKKREKNQNADTAKNKPAPKVVALSKIKITDKIKNNISKITKEKAEKTPLKNGQMIKQILEVFEEFFFHLGFYTEYIVVLLGRRIKKIIIALGKILLKEVVFFAKPFKIIGLSIWAALAEPIERMQDGYKNIRTVIAEEKEASKKDAAKKSTVYFVQGVKKHTHLVANLAMWAVSGVLCFVLFNTVSTTISKEYALHLSVDGAEIGYVENEENFEFAKQEIQAQMVYTNEQEQAQPWSVTPEYAVTLLGDNEISSKAQVVEKMLDSFGTDIVEATGFYVDGVFHGATTEPDLLQAGLNAKLAPYETTDENKTVEFIKDVELRKGVFIADSVRDVGEIITLLDSTEAGSQYYEIQDGDTISGMANKHDLSASELISLNPEHLGDGNMYHPGDTLRIKNEVKFLQVKVVEVITEAIAIPHGYEKTYDYDKPFGQKTVTVSGADGSKDVTTETTYIDGIISEEKVIESIVTLEPVTEVLVEGRDYHGAAVVPPSGVMMWPVPSTHRLSRGASYGHMALDIPAPAGTAIVASESGIVIKSVDTYYGYGKHVVIDHGNGVVTLYAHMSQRLVSAGQTVTKGEIIGLVGSTGMSTGNHLHYETVVNGVQVNPARYVS